MPCSDGCSIVRYGGAGVGASTAGKKSGEEVLGKGSSLGVGDIFGVTVNMKDKQTSAV